MLSRALPGTKRLAGSPRKHAVPATSACFARGCVGFALVAIRGESMAPATTRFPLLWIDKPARRLDRWPAVSLRRAWIESRAAPTPFADSGRATETNDAWQDTP